MADETLFRRLTISSDAVNTLKERKGLLHQAQSINGKSIQAVNPATVVLTGTNRSCAGNGPTKSPLPMDITSHRETYQNFKPYPSVKSVKLDFAGDWGFAQHLSAEIECYTKDDVDAVRNSFLLPGNYVDLKIFYSTGKNKWHSTSTPTVNLKGFVVATFAFSANSDGTWICSFTAVSAAASMKNIDVGLRVGAETPMTFITYSSGVYGGEVKRNIHSVHELILYDSQRNGEEPVSKLKDGHVLSGAKDFNNYTPAGTILNKNAALVAYNGNYLMSSTERVAGYLNSFMPTSQVEQNNVQIYVTLGYIVNRIINDQLKKTVTMGMCPDDKTEFDKICIQFHPKYSKTKVAKNLRSGDPLSVLILGVRRGNYRPNDGYEYKDFEDIKAGPAADVTAHEGNDVIDLSKILIHKDVVVSCISAATKVREANADTTGVKDCKEEVVNIIDFFKAISDAVNAATGGAISLRLVEDASLNNKKDHLYVVDQNYGGKTASPLDCWVFDPIGGDGSTRSCELSSDGGSDTYKLDMYSGMSKSGDPAASMRGCTSDLNAARKKAYNKAWKDFYDLVYGKGTLAKDQFSRAELDGCRSAMATMHKNRENANVEETVHFPGCNMHITIDGTWGFVPCNAMMTTQYPGSYQKDGIYFMITRVTHTITQSDWTTDLDGIMAFYSNVKYISN